MRVILTLNDKKSIMRMDGVDVDVLKLRKSENSA